MQSAPNYLSPVSDGYHVVIADDIEIVIETCKGDGSE